MKTSRAAGAAILALALAACAMQPAYQRPALQAPTAWANSSPKLSATSASSTEVTSDQWWRQLNDTAIDDLTAAALSDNPTVAQALGRIDEAQATLNIDKAHRRPSMDLSGNAARQQSQYLVSSAGPYTLMMNSAAIGPSLGWELDLWGRLRESAMAARRRLDERNADAQGTRLSLAARVADTVLNLRACRYSLKVSDRDIASRETELELMRLRLEVGNVAPAEHASAVGNLATARTNRISRQEQCTRYVDALVALSGRDARTVSAAIAQPLAASGSIEPRRSDIANDELATLSGQSPMEMPTAPAIRLELPATVLLVHPSVVSAEREAAAAWAEIAVARAERLPQINLQAIFNGQWLSAFGQHVHFDTWSVGSSFSVPLFDGGAGAAHVRGAEARYAEAVENLRAVLRNTVQDIEDTLAAQASAEERTVTTQDAEKAAVVSLRANEARWQAGAISRFELENARRDSNTAHENAIAAARDCAQAWVDLVRASGSAAALRDAASMSSDRPEHEPRSVLSRVTP